MKNTLTTLLLLFLIPFSAYSQVDLDYYLPDDVDYNPDIPTPAEVIGHEVGEWHVTHDKLVNYMYALAESSDRVTIEEYGQTYEGRPVLLLTITSTENRGQLDEIKANQHALTQSDQSGDVDIENQPVVVTLGHSIHGNEASGVNASLVTAYYFTAAQGSKIDNILENTVILLDPSFNPDGMTRFSTWVNFNKSIKSTVTDPNDREYNEWWPRGRTNHYWFDLNRDWLPVQHPESRSKVKKFQEWRPNVLTDHHEMGSNSSFFFMPGVPSRKHPLTPQINQDLTKKIGEYHAKALDDIQSLYFSQENYDDFYYGKGSTYPDLFGTIGILFEQASARGHAQETDNGVLTFPFAIRNHFTTALSTVDAAVDLRIELHEYRRDFYNDVADEVSDLDARAFVIGDSYDEARNYHLADIFAHHNVDVYELADDIEVDGKEFKNGKAWVIPTNQAEYKFVESVLEERTTFTDSLFYDVSTWTLPFAFNLPYAELDGGDFDEDLLGAPVDEPEFPTGEIIGGRSDYAYMFSWDEYYAPRTLYRLQSKGVRTKVASKPMTVHTTEGTKTFDYGSIMVGLGIQDVDEDEIYSILQTAAEEDGVDIYNIPTGASMGGTDLGSPSLESIEKPSVAMLTGGGVRSYDAGEVWHLMDQRYHIPLTKLETDAIGWADLSRYNTIILPDGRYNDLSDNSVSELKRWVRNGGTLILEEAAIGWGISQELVNLKRKQPAEGEEFEYSEDLTYADIRNARGAQVIGGAIFNAELDITNPLGYGYHDTSIHVFRSGTNFYQQPENHWAAPVSLTSDPLASGYISDYNLTMIENTPSVVVDSFGGGRVISFIDNPNFRAFWFGTNKLFANAIFFGNTISGAAAN